ncbi:MAG: glycosyltransferase family 61 protein [Myxococcota bacterium]
MERRYELDVPAYPLPETRVFAHATRMSDFDSPEIERILKPPSVLPAHPVQIALRDGLSRTHIEHYPAPEALAARAKYEIKRRLHDRAPVLDLGDRLAFEMRFYYMGNFAHLVHDVIAPVRLIEQVLAADPEIGDSPIHVILPKNAPALAMRVLDAAGLPYVCTDGRVRARHLTISQDLNIAHLPHLARQPYDPGAEPTPERVYVSRRGERVVLNEEAVVAFLEKEGYVRVFMEDHPIERQWALLAKAREVVGIHGAGLSSLGFSIQRAQGEGPRFRLVELFSPGFSSTCFRLYAGVLGGSWVGVRGRITPEVVRDLDLLGHARAHDMASFEVDLDALGEALAYSRSEADWPRSLPPLPVARRS